MILAGPICHGGPCRPSHKRGELTQFGRVDYQVRLQPPVAGGMFEVVGPIADLLTPRLRFRGSQRQYTAERVVAIDFQHQRNFGLQPCALHRVQFS